MEIPEKERKIEEIKKSYPEKFASEEKMFSYIGPGNRIFIGTACGEPLLEYRPASDDEIAQRIGKYVAELIQDGDTIQVGYGSLPNAILSNLEGKKHLGVHSELLGDGIADLMKRKVIDNTQKTINRGKTVVSFCMGKKETYDYIHDNPSIEFRTIDYTNNPLVIAQHHNMTAINTALEIVSVHKCTFSVVPDLRSLPRT